MKLSNNKVFYFEPFRIETGKVKEFAKALAIDKVFTVNSLVPPTFFTVIDYWNDRSFYQMLEEFNIPSNNVVHGEQSYEYMEDVYVGDLISAKVILLKTLQKNNKIFYFLETIYINEKKITVAIGRSTLIELVVDSA